MTATFDLLLDTSGLLCPEPVMLLHGAIREVDSGQIIKVIATDPSTTRDIPSFCRFLGHELVASEVAGSSYLYFIRKQ
ncbi:MAG: sulfurtransferase TusA [Porticoccaceae bacterium]